MDKMSRNNRYLGENIHSLQKMQKLAVLFNLELEDVTASLDKCG